MKDVSIAPRRGETNGEYGAIYQVRKILIDLNLDYGGKKRARTAVSSE